METIQNHLLFYTACFGLTLIVTSSSLLDKVRTKYIHLKLVNNLINCPMCVGFWTGLLVPLVTDIVPVESIDIRIIYALSSSAACHIFWTKLA